MTGAMLIVTATLGRIDLSALAESLAALKTEYEWVVVCPQEAHARVLASASKFGCRPRIIEDTFCNGLYAALNLGINETIGDHQWFTYINDDDTLLPAFDDLVEAHCVEMNQRSVAYAKVWMTDRFGRYLFDFPISNRPHDAPQLWRRGIMPFTQQGMLAPRTAWEQLRGFDESYKLSSDLDFWIRAHGANFKFQFYDFSVATWRVRSGQLSASYDSVCEETSRCLATHFPVRRLELKNILAVARFRWSNRATYFRRIMRTRRFTQSSIFRTL